MDVANLMFFKLSGSGKNHIPCLIKEITASDQKLDSFVKLFLRKRSVII